jgi:(2Fe-2S) ferredoxin
MTGCLNCCVNGPVVIDYPAGHWYKGVTEDAADAILDAIENDTVAEEYLLA